MSVCVSLYTYTYETETHTEQGEKKIYIYIIIGEYTFSHTPDIYKNGSGPKPQSKPQQLSRNKIILNALVYTVKMQGGKYGVQYFPNKQFLSVALFFFF